MRTTILLSAIVVGIALAGCGKPVTPPPSATPKCTANACFIAVTVNGDCSKEDNISVEPNRIPIDKDNHGNDGQGPEIHWDISTQGYTFSSVQTGIVFGTNPAPPAGEFHHPNLTNQNRKYKLKDKNSSTQTYKYTVNLLDKDNKACAPKDPFIANGN